MTGSGASSTPPSCAPSTSGTDKGACPTRQSRPGHFLRRLGTVRPAPALATTGPRSCARRAKPWPNLRGRRGVLTMRRPTSTAPPDLPARAALPHELKPARMEAGSDHLILRPEAGAPMRFPLARICRVICNRHLAWSGGALSLPPRRRRADHLGRWPWPPWAARRRATRTAAPSPR